MGKTYISSMLGKDYDNVIILSPSRALAQQNLYKFKEYLKNGYNYILVSVDGKTNIDEINKILKNKNIISSTYDSCDIVNLLITKLKKCYIIVDEFHNLSDNNINDPNNQINKLISYEINKIFVSATPIKNFMNIAEKNIYTYKWDDAIKNKYICDFNIYLANISNELTKFMEAIKNYNVTEMKLIKKAYNLVKSMLFNGDKKCICYLTTIEKATLFNKILTLIASTFNIEIEREQIDCNTRKLKRGEIIEKFKNSTELFILLNVHVLDEGIDIPECDSVYVTQPNNNIINIVQRMCRANRIYKDKIKCNIYLWCSEKKIINIMNYLFEKTDGHFNNKIIKNNTNNELIIKNSEILINDNGTKLINNKLINYKNIFETHKVEIIIIQDEKQNVWFQGKKICEILNYKNSKDTIDAHVKNNNKKNLMDIDINYKVIKKNIQGSMLFINEIALFDLIHKTFCNDNIIAQNIKNVFICK
jgi:ERCC4-related helicase